MSATRFNDALLALLGLYQAAPALASVPVYDGPRARSTTDPDYIVVGHDGTIDAEGNLAADVTAGTFAQSNLEFGVRQETGYLNCLIVSWTGDAEDLAGVRQRADDLLGLAEDAAAANGGLQSGQAAGVIFDGTSDGRYRTRLSQGLAVIIAYRVYYSTEWN